MKVIHHIGLQRNGCHAITNWIMMQSASSDGTEKLEDFNYRNNIFKMQFKNGKYALLFNYLFPEQETIRTDLITDFENCELIVLLYECSIIGLHNQRSHVKDLELLSSKASSEETLISLRDVKNAFASMVEKYGHVPEHIITHWKERAIAILNEEIEGAHFISFNHWEMNNTYRRLVAESLGLKFTDYGKEIIPNFGEGSSFKDKSTTVLTRYKKHVDNPYFKHALNEKLLELSRKIFGDV